MKMETWRHAQNLQVVSLDEGEFLGRLDDFQFDLDTHAIYGWRLKGQAMFATAGGVAARHVQLVGRNVALVTEGRRVEWESQRPVVEGRAWASQYRGTAALTRRGARLGGIQDFVIDRAGDRVTGLVLQGHRLLPLDERVHVGPDAVVALSEDVLIQLPGDEGDESWWARLKEAIGVGPKTEGETGEPTSEPPAGS